MGAGEGAFWAFLAAGRLRLLLLEAFLVLEAFLEAGRLLLLEVAFLFAVLRPTADLLRLRDLDAAFLGALVAFLAFLGAGERPRLADRLAALLVAAFLAAGFLDEDLLLERLRARVCKNKTKF